MNKPNTDYSGSVGYDHGEDELIEKEERPNFCSLLGCFIGGLLGGCQHGDR